MLLAASRIPAARVRCGGPTAPTAGTCTCWHPPKVVLATARGHAQALCAQPVSAGDLTITDGLSGALCLTCLTACPHRDTQPQPAGRRPLHRWLARRSSP
ncbi:MAG TPA: hypothetical protein VN327_02845 [Pseudonocardiaceae bacterium]|nr:hypothetical protein [Pseudonocardiaceae bacterium]